MPELVLPIALLGEIRDIVYATDAETGVRLIGCAAGDRYLVRHIIGPGPAAVERRYAYECDNDFAEERFHALRTSDSGLRFLGELHVHPDGFPHLSGLDRQTIAEVLREYQEFIAGVIERDPLRIHPFLFTNHSEQPMEVCYDFCPKSEGTRSPVRQARAGGRLWQCWLRRLRDVGPRRHRRAHDR